MSAFLLGTGFRADMGTCIRKLVLLKLIDACDDDGSRIFPAIATVALAAQCSPRQVQREIKGFLEVGLLRLVRRGGNGPKSTNEYALDLDILFQISRIGWDAHVLAYGAGNASDSEEKKGDSLSPLPNKGDTGDTLRVTATTLKGDNTSPPTPYYPSNYPSTVRERKHGAKDKDGVRPVEEAFWRTIKGWPDSAGMPKDGWKREWFSLTADERELAEQRRDVWLAGFKSKGRTHIPVPGTYFREKLFTEIPDPAAPGTPKNMLAPAFGKLWNAARLVDLLQPPTGRIAGLSGFDRSQIEAGILTHAEVMRGKVKQMGWPSVSMMHERAAQAIGFVCPSALEPIAHDFQKVHRDSELYQAWAAEHERRGWMFFENLRPPEWLYFPAIDPDTAPLAAAVRAALDDFAIATAQFQKRGQSHDAA